ncbi:MAG: asparaginase [Anaerolineae bacterium]|nr:asparaginase [Anaerolineae bacterium]
MEEHEPVLVEVTRGSIVEAWHHGALVAVSTDGTIIAAVGNPDWVTYLRSAAKPFQALSVVESGAADHYGLSERELAVICGSHAAEPCHVEAVRSILGKIGLDESALHCGAHMPGSEEAARALIRAGESPQSIHNNCSGKHSGMLALARFWGADVESYLEPTHPVQVANRRVVAEMAGLRPEEIIVGVDGCSVPTFAIPLRAAARAFARLSDPAGLSPARQAACRRIVAAMQAHPEMVGASTGSFDSDLMRALGTRVVSKGGAEGFHGVGVLPAAGRPALGLALKVEDGIGDRARGLAMLEALRQLGVVGGEDLKSLARYVRRPLHNHRRVEVGELRPVFFLNHSVHEVLNG